MPTQVLVNYGTRWWYEAPEYVFLSRITTIGTCNCDEIDTFMARIANKKFKISKGVPTINMICIEYSSSNLVPSQKRFCARIAAYKKALLTTNVLQQNSGACRKFFVLTPQLLHGLIRHIELDLHRHNEILFNEVTSVPVCRDSPCNETKPRYFGFGYM